MSFTYAEWKKRQADREESRAIIEHVRAEFDKLLSLYPALRILAEAIESRVDQQARMEKRLGKLHAKYENDPGALDELSNALQEDSRIWHEVSDLFDVMLRELTLAKDTEKTPESRERKLKEKKEQEKEQQMAALSPLARLWMAQQEKK